MPSPQETQSSGSVLKAEELLLEALEILLSVRDDSPPGKAFQAPLQQTLGLLARAHITLTNVRARYF